MALCYFYIKEKHESRFEKIPKRICEFLGKDEPACSNMPHLEQQTNYCRIKPLY